ncbi:MAG: cell division protein SepF [Microthrixaceae bacterium]
MSNWMKNTKTWLGLGNDPYYEDEYGDPDVEEEYEDSDLTEGGYEEPERQPARSSSQSRGAVRAVPSSTRTKEDWEDGDGGVRVISSAAADNAPTRGVVRPLPSSAKPQIVSPTGFNDVQQVADTFKRDQPVIVNLQGVDKELSRRLIDFASGLCYGLEGDMERVSDQIFLLTPRGAEVSEDERRRMRNGDLGNDGR